MPSKVRHRVVCRPFNAEYFSFNVNSFLCSKSLSGTQNTVKFKGTCPSREKSCDCYHWTWPGKKFWWLREINQYLSFKYMEFVLTRKHFLTDVAVVTINSETVSFLKTLGCAKKGMPANKVTLRTRKRTSIKSVDQYPMWRSALNCHEKLINGTEGTVFKKTQDFLLHYSTGWTGW